MNLIETEYFIKINLVWSLWSLLFLHLFSNETAYEMFVNFLYSLYNIGYHVTMNFQTLVDTLSIPVNYNGSIYTDEDAIKAQAETVTEWLEMKEIPDVAAHENSSSLSSLKKDIVLKFLISFWWNACHFIRFIFMFVIDSDSVLIVTMFFALSMKFIRMLLGMF